MILSLIQLSEEFPGMYYIMLHTLLSSELPPSYMASVVSVLITWRADGYNFIFQQALAIALEGNIWNFNLKQLGSSIISSPM